MPDPNYIPVKEIKNFIAERLKEPQLSRAERFKKEKFKQDLNAFTQRAFRNLQIAHERVVIPGVSQVWSALPKPQEGKGKEFLLNLLAGPLGMARNAQLLNFDQFLKEQGGISPEGIIRSAATLMKPFAPSPFDPFMSELSARGVLPPQGPMAGPMEGLRARERYRKTGDPEDAKAYWEFAAGAAPGTKKRARVEAARQRAEGQIPGSFVQAEPRKLSARETELIEQKEYPLPKHVRGLSEELPWFLIPEARLMRGGLATARSQLGQLGKRTFAVSPKGEAAIKYAGKFGKKFTPVVQAGLRAAEDVLKPLELLETAASKAIRAPFVGGQVLARKVSSRLERKRIEARIGEDIATANEDIVAMDLNPQQRQEQANAAAMTFNKVMAEDLDITSGMVGKSKYVDPETGGELPNIAIAEGGVVKAVPLPKDAPILPEQVAKATREAAEAVEEVDTRGKGKFYHGAADEFELSEGGEYGSDSGIFGQGLYTTDDLKTARAYQRKNRKFVSTDAQEAVYSTKEKQPVKFYDLDKDIDPEIIEFFRGDPEVISYTDEAEMIEGALDNLKGKSFSLGKLMDEIRAWSNSLRISRSEVQDLFDGLKFFLRDKGYGGFVHQGGRKAGKGKRLHQVKIYWDPSDQLTINLDQRPLQAAKDARVSAMESVELPVINKKSRPDLPEEYFDNAGELLSEDALIEKHIKPITDMIVEDKPERGWSAIVKKLERKMYKEEDNEMIENVQEVIDSIDEYRNVEREGSLQDYGYAKDEAFDEISQSVGELRVSDAFMDVLEESARKVPVQKVEPDLATNIIRQLQDEAYAPVGRAIEQGKPPISKKALLENIDAVYDVNPDALPRAREQYVRDYGDQIGRDIDERIKQLTPTPVSEKLSTEQVDKLLDRVGEPSIAKASGMSLADRRDILKQVDVNILKQYDDLAKKLEGLDESIDLDKVLRAGSSIADAPMELKWAHAFRASDKIKDKTLIKSASDQVDKMRESGVPLEEIPYELKWANAFQKSSDNSVKLKQQTKVTFVDDADAVASEALRVANSDLPENPMSKLMDRNPSLMQERTGGDLNKVLDQTPYVRGLKIIEDITNDSNFIDFNTEQLMSRIKDDNPLSADWYVRWKHRLWDSTAAIRILQDNYFRSIDPGAAFKLGSKRDLLSGVMLTHGQVGAAIGHYESFMIRKVKPFLDRLDGNEVVTEYKLNRYLQAKNWENIKNNVPERGDQFPDYINELGEKTPSGGWENWITDMQKEMDSVSFAKLEAAAENVKLEYQRFRTELLEHGIITQEFHDELRDAWDWYLPNTYIEYMNTEKMPSGAMSNLSDGILALSRDPDALKLGMTDEIVTAADPLGETLARSYIHHKLRLHKNGVARSFINMGKEMQIGLVPAKQTLYGKSNKYMKQPDGTLEKIIDGSDLYDEELKTGYISFIENGERQIYGQLKTDGTVGPIRKIWWEGLNGRAGLNTLSGAPIERFFRNVSQFYRHNLTTYDPLFFASNGLIDSLGIMLRYRIMPTSVAARIASRVSTLSRDEKRVREIMEASGAYVSSVTGRDYRLIDNDGLYAKMNNQKVLDSIEKANREGRQQSAHILDARNEKEMNKFMTEASRDFFDYKSGRVDTSKFKRGKKYVSAPFKKIVKAGEIIEQAPRQLAFEKSLKKSIGNKKMWGNDVWNRLMKLSDEEFYDELYGASKNVVRNVRNSKTEISLAEAIKIDPNSKIGRTIKTKGFIDSPEVRRAAINGMESTINFQRGGSWIKKVSPYWLFLNASAEGGKWIGRTLGIDLLPSARPVVDPDPKGPAFTWGKINRVGDVVEAKGWKESPFAGRGITGKYGETLGDFMGKKVPGGERAAALFTFSLATAADQSVMYWNMSFAEHQDVPDEVKYGSFYVMLRPDRDENGEVIINHATGRPYPKYITIPHRLRNLAVWFAPQRWLHMKIAEEFGFYNPEGGAPTSFGNMSWILFNELSPISSVSHFLPYILKGPAELAINKNLYFNEPIVDPAYENAVPEEQFNKYTTESARLTSEILGEEADWIPKSFRSASRIDYLRNFALPISSRAMGYADYVLMELLNSRKRERQPMDQKVKEFKLMPRLEQDEYKASLSREDRDKFDKAMRSKPLSDENRAKALWDNSGIKQRFSGNSTGGISKIQRRAAEKSIKEAFGVEIDKNDSKRFHAEFEKNRKEKFHEQQEDDDKLGLGQMTADEWHENLKDRASFSEGFYEAQKVRFPKGIQAQEDEVKELWFDDYYTAAGTIEDTREPYMNWISAIHKIKTPDEDPSKTWTQYFSERDDLKREAVRYLEDSPMLQPDGTPYPDQAERFYRQLEASWTKGQKSWYRTNEILSQEVPVLWGGRNIKASYWDAGRDLQVLYPGYKLNQKVIQAWKVYVETGTDRTARNTRDDLKKDFPFLRGAVKERSKLRDQVVRAYNVKYGGPLVEHLLVYWYGTILSEEGQRYKDAKRQLDQTRIPQVPIQR